MLREGSEAVKVSNIEALMLVALRYFANPLRS
jgi:hypothetical protein